MRFGSNHTATWLETQHDESSTAGPMTPNHNAVWAEGQTLQLKKD